MIFIVGATLAAFLCFLLSAKKQKTQSDHILLVWMAVLALHQGLMLVSATSLGHRAPHLLGLSFPFPLFHGILLYCYAWSITTGQQLSLLKVLPHLLPPLVLTALALPFYCLSGPEKIAVFENGGKGYEWYNLGRIAMILATGVGYVVWTLRLIRRHRAAVENEYSNTERKTLRWLEYLSIGLAVLWLLVAFFDDTVIFAGVVLFVLFIGFYGIQQLPVFHALDVEKTPASPSKKEVALTEGDPIRYAKSGLKAEEADRVYAGLNKLMAEKALFKDPELTLADLARQLDIHPNYLSQVINEREQKNFYHYINSLRVQEFLRVAGRPEQRNFTLLAIAFDCGFNSKSTFNKYFKHHTGKTPTEYFEKPNN